MQDPEKKQFDALMALTDFRLKRIFNRRDYEWKVTLGIWALFAAGISTPAPLQVFDRFYVVPCIVVAALFHIVLWIRDHWKKSEMDWAMAFWSAEAAEAIAKQAGAPYSLEERRQVAAWRGKSFLTNYTSLLQVLTTFLLAALLVLRVVMTVPTLNI